MTDEKETIKEQPREKTKKEQTKIRYVVLEIIKRCRIRPKNNER